METAIIVTIIVLGLVLAIAGLIGCIIPIVPGPILSFISLILISWVKNWEPFSASLLLVMGGLTIFVLILDYVFPLVGAKKFGASKLSVFLSVVGMVIGLFTFPPFGIFIGGFIGAMAGELYVGKSGEDAFKAGFGVFLGNLISIGLKLGLCAVMLFFYVKAML
jgi:uncharacterized protein YqgC (DUF456 family)